MIPRLRFAGDLCDEPALAACLAQTGLGAGACLEKASLFSTAAGALASSGNAAGDDKLVAFFVPGRIEVLGKHTDYAGGHSLLVAAERGFALVAVPRPEPICTVIDARSGQQVEFPFSADLVPTVGDWSNYPMTVVRRLARNFPTARTGARLALASDLPPAAGMSSSSALMVAVFLGLAAVNRLSSTAPYRKNIRDRSSLAGYLGTIENGQTFGSLPGDRGVGTFGGSEDHTAMLCCQAGQLSEYAYRPVELQRVLPMPAGFTFAVGSSGVVAEKTGAAREKYNRASRLVSAIEQLWNEGHGGERRSLSRIISGDPDAPIDLNKLVRRGTAEFSGEALLARLEHFFVENEQVIPAAGNALVAGDLEAFGRRVDQSQAAAEELLGNQIPQTSLLAELARKRGAVAASAFGAGFGGSVWALVEEQKAAQFLAEWSAAYREKFPEDAARAEFFVTGAGPAAFQAV